MGKLGKRKGKKASFILLFTVWKRREGTQLEKTTPAEADGAPAAGADPEILFNGQN